MADAAYDVGSVALADGIENFDLSFLPKNLTAQCQSLIVSYHELHGYACLPNILWKARLGHFIEAHQEFRQLLKKASTTRSAKKSNEGFVRIATTILSLEILASSFAGWSAIYPQAGLIARAILQANCAQPAYAFDGVLSVSAQIYQFGRHRDACSAREFCNQPTRNCIARRSRNSPTRSWPSITPTRFVGRCTEGRFIWSRHRRPSIRLD